MINLQPKSVLGLGVFTPPDIAHIFNVPQAGESSKTLSILYNITEKQIHDAIQFHKRAA